MLSFVFEKNAWFVFEFSYENIVRLGRLCLIDTRVAVHKLAIVSFPNMDGASGSSSGTLTNPTETFYEKHDSSDLLEPSSKDSPYM